MQERDRIIKYINDHVFLNNKLKALSAILAVIWALIFLFCILPSVTNITWLSSVFLAGLGGAIIYTAIGIIGKIVYSKKTVKCINCGATSKADKYFCGNCGEKIDDDDLFGHK